MKRQLLGLAGACVIVLTMVSSTFANVSYSYTETPSSNGQVTFDIIFGVGPDPGYLRAVYGTGGLYGDSYVTTQFGDGSSLTMDPLPASGCCGAEVNFVHTYVRPGMYTPSFTALINYNEDWNIYAPQWVNSFQAFNPTDMDALSPHISHNPSWRADWQIRRG
jgi:hypothetical protein